MAKLKGNTCIGNNHTIVSGVGHFVSGECNTVGTSDCVVNYSTAMGYCTTASNFVSTAIGDCTTASGCYSTAMGYNTTASNCYSTAMGYNTTASNCFSTAMGYNTTASGIYSTAMGQKTIASGYNSTAIGYNTTVSGNFSIAMGQNTIASAYTSTAMGYGTTACAYYSTAMGYNTTASGSYSTAMGYNSDTSCPANTVEASTTWHYNSIRVRIEACTGKGYFDGGTDVGAADYAEYFESFDGACIPVGKFVSFMPGTSCICEGNGQLLGITSAAPGVTGDSAEMNYRGKFLRDEFERVIMEEQEFETDFNIKLEKRNEEYMLEHIAEDITRVDITITSGDEVVHITDLDEAKQPITINNPENAKVTGKAYVTMTDGVKRPDYDENIEYIPRSQRPEWGPVGLLGKLWVYYADGEEIVVGDYVTSNENGDAIKCNFGDPDSHRVIDVNPEYKLVKVFYK